MDASCPEDMSGLEGIGVAEVASLKDDPDDQLCQDDQAQTAWQALKDRDAQAV